MRVLLKYPLAALVLITSAAGVGCASTDSFSLNGRRSEKVIRERLLSQTPIGTPVNEVTAFINRRLKHEGGWFPANRFVSQYIVPSSRTPQTRFEHNTIPDLTPRFSEEWRVEFLNLRMVVSIHQGLPFRVWTTATWQFGRDGTLKEIVVEKQVDGL